VKQRPDNERSVSADRSCVGWLPFLETRLHRCALTSTLENKKMSQTVLVMMEFSKSSAPSGIVFFFNFPGHLHVKVVVIVAV
jgi:hypothetical protein